MKNLIVFCCIIAFAAADIKHLTDRNLDLFKYDPGDIYTLPEDIDEDKPAVVYEGDVMKAKTERLQNLSGPKKFKLDLKTQNGIEVTSVGKLKDEKTFVVSGSYSFTGADGKRYKTRYTADEFGYHPITELDLDIPEPQPLNTDANLLGFGTRSGFDSDRFGSSKNRFQFLNQNIDGEGNGDALRGSGQSGDDYSYGNGDHSSSGYDYQPPKIDFDTPPNPSRLYLPAQ